MEKSAKKQKNLNEVIKKTLNKKLKKISLFINESILTGKTIINVDIQPEYSKAIGFNINEWVNFINKNSDTNNIIFLFNGHDTLGMITEFDYKMWLYDLGIDEDIISDKAIF
jgi:hypothetical protein